MNESVQSAVEKALKMGAEAADAVLIEETSLSVSWRGGKLEELERSESGALGLRVFFGKRQASAATTDLSAGAVEEAASRAVAMARAAPEDPFCGLAAEEDLARNYPVLEEDDEQTIEAEKLIALAKEAEEAALGVRGVSQCESASAGGGRTRIALAASNGFMKVASRTRYGIGVSALAGEGTAMERDSEHASKVFFDDLPSATSIGQKAGERAVSHLGARKMPSCQAAVVFDPREARSLLGELAGAISGSAVARGSSFLKDKMGEKLFADDVFIVDDPFLPRGLRSKSFDGEGILPQKRNVIENGRLTTWLLDLRSARQLGLSSTGHARRGTSGVSPPGPSNFYLAGGKCTPQELMQGIKQGFYVTETMGHGANSVTGDYSLAARGFWIENGQIAFPVSEMTIAGNLKDMFARLTAADDLVFLHGIDAPTIRIEDMTIAGL